MSPLPDGRSAEQRQGFTLIELMIALAIIGILASIAVPQYEAFLFRAKRTELPLNLDAIRLAEHAYHAQWDFYTTCVLSPTAVPGRAMVNFPATETTALDWNQLGWTPDGRVYGQYRVTANNAYGEEADFTADAFGDIDGDGNLANYQATRFLKPALLTSNTIY
jgi:prepilin-type N-terminal cleavage/methylation domain-containing protein